MSIPSHQLVNGELRREQDGITARCVCGWVSGGHFTSLAAAAAFRDHQEKATEPQPVN